MHIIVAVLIELGPLTLRELAGFEVQEGGNVGHLAVSAIYFALCKKVENKSNLLEVAFAIGKFAKIYDQTRSLFIDGDRSFAQQNVVPDSVVIVSNVTDEKRLRDFVQVRQLTDLERLAMEIHRGD